MKGEHLFASAENVMIRKVEEVSMDAAIEFVNVYYRRWFNKDRGDFCK